MNRLEGAPTHERGSHPWLVTEFYIVRLTFLLRQKWVMADKTKGV